MIRPYDDRAPHQSFGDLEGLPLAQQETMAVTAGVEPLPPAAERGLARAAAKREHEIARLVPLAQELARKAGPAGITVADLRLYAVQRGYLTGAETGKQLAYLGAVMRRAGLVATSEFRRSIIEKSHGNLHRTYRAP